MGMDSRSRPGTQVRPPEASDHLLILTGGQRDQVLALRPGATLIGSSPKADVCLTAKGVASIHCALLQHEGKWVLRDTSRKGGTFVNGKRIDEIQVADGDLLTIGTVQAQLRLVESPSRSIIPIQEWHSEAARRTMRIQVAALVAQQIAVHEQEHRLAQRRAVLEQQQRQLADHLEEKRAQLDKLLEETQKARKQLREERLEYERRVEEVSHSLSESQVEMLHEKKLLVEQRERLAKLRERLKQRAEEHWERQQRRIEEHEALLADAWQYLSAKQSQLRREQEELANVCLRFNTDVEIGRRRLEYEWRTLRRRQREFAEYVETWMTHIREREDEVIGAERELLEAQRGWRHKLAQLRRDAANLERRIRHQRSTIAEQTRRLERLKREFELHGQRQVASPHAQVTDGREARVWPIALPIPEQHRIENWLFRGDPPVVASGDNREETIVAILAADLFEQRRQIADYWKQLHEVEASQRAAYQRMFARLVEILDRLRRVARALVEREEQLRAFAEELAVEKEELSSRNNELRKLQGQLQAKQIRWETERDLQAADLNSRAALLARQLEALQELRNRWDDERKQEVERFREARLAWEKAMSELESLARQKREELRRLAEDRQELAAKMLAFEEIARKQLRTAKNRERAERRIEQLKEKLLRGRKQLTELPRQEKQELEAQLAQWHAYSRSLQQTMKTLEQERIKAEQRAEELEQRVLDAENSRLSLEERVEAAQRRADAAWQQVDRLQQELERMAAELVYESDGISVTDATPTSTDAAALDRAA